MNFDKIGKMIARVKDNKKYSGKVLSVYDEYDDDEKHFNELKLNDGEFQLIPDKDADRDTIFICGSAGSGKSYFAGQYCKEYHKAYPENNIYLISEGAEDPALDNLKKLNRIKFDDDFWDDPIEWTDFDNCLVIFDDIDAMTGKLGKFIYALRDKLLKNARKNKVSVITTNHTCTGLELKAVLNESNIIVFFPKNWNRQLKYLVDSYIGLTKKDIEKLRSKKSRWCCFVKSFPNVIIEQKDIFTVGLE